MKIFILRGLGAIGRKSRHLRASVVAAIAQALLLATLHADTAVGSTLFAAQFLSFDTGNLPLSVAIGDLNGDGKPDLATANNTVSVLLGNGDGSFGMKTDYGTGSGPS